MKRTPRPKEPTRNLTTYFLAQKSGLFRPGAALMLSVSLPTRKGDILSKSPKKGSRK